MVTEQDKVTAANALAREILRLRSLGKNDEAQATRKQLRDLGYDIKNTPGKDPDFELVTV